jgi:hypothetical protein
MPAKRSTARGSRKKSPAGEGVNPSSSAAPVDAAPISLAQLAKLGHRSRQAVWKLTRPGGPLAAAMLADGSIDARHPAALEWLARGIDAATDGDRDDVDPLDHDDENLEHLVADLARWRAVKVRADARLADRRDHVLAGRLISRELVRTNVFSHLDALHVRLLRDAPTTLAMHVRTAANNEEAIGLIRDQLSAHLARAKAQVIHGLRACRTSDNPPDVAPHQHIDARESVSSQVIEALAVAMRSKAAPRVLELVLRSFARHAAGKPWTAEIFDDAMALRGAVESDVLAAIANVLVSQAEAAVRVADRAQAARPEPEEHAHAPA